jgi:hypothetical protein
MATHPDVAPADQLLILLYLFFIFALYVLSSQMF